MQHSVNFLAGYGYVEGRPKTAAGKRGIDLPAFLLDMLEQHRAEQRGMQQAREAWEDRDLVFPNLPGGYLHPNHLGEAFRKILKEIGLPALRFHDLRHSAATILLAMNVHPKVVQEILGHSQITTTMDIYSHAMPDMQESAIEQWESKFGKIEKRGHQRGNHSKRDGKKS